MGLYLLLLLGLFAEVSTVRVVLDDILVGVVHAVHQQLEALLQVVTTATDRQSLVQQSLRNKRLTAHQSVIAPQRSFSQLKTQDDRSMMCLIRMTICSAFTRFRETSNRSMCHQT